MTEREAYILLNMMNDVGPVSVRRLVEAFGGVLRALEAPLSELQQVRGVGARAADAIVRQRESLDLEGEIEAARREGIRLVSFVDDEYPALLREIYDPPLALYARGTLEPSDRHAIAVVGSRRTTHYGRTVADRLSYQLAKVGYRVISGLARGIDTAAHEGALKGGGRTLAVVGSGLGNLYPPENRKLADAIAAQGCVLSEFPMARQPDKTTFPMRNRIVSGLSAGVVVVEADRTSGAMNTAKQALDQGRSVFAVPGRVDASTSSGCHLLIKQGARLVEGVDDVLEEFEMLIPAQTLEQAKVLDQRPEVSLSSEEQSMVRALWEEPLTVDELARRVGLDPASLSARLMTLEMKRVVRMLPGRRVELLPSMKSGA